MLFKASAFLSMQNGIVLLVLCFLSSPIIVAIWLLDVRFAVQDTVYE